jgi:hypothetical protein
MMNWDEGDTHAVGFYTSYADMTDIYGTHMRWDPALERDRWYCIEAYVRLNTISGPSGNNDGVLRGWVDDVQAFDRADLRFRDVVAPNVEEVRFNVCLGGSRTADHDMELYFDNLVVSPNRVGCHQGGSGGAGAGGGGSGASSAGGSGASAGATGAGGSGASGTSGTGGITAAPADSGDDSSCGCRMVGSRRSSTSALLGRRLGVGALSRRQERR